MPAQLFPEIRDTSTLTGVFTRSTFFVIGVEGEMGADGTATVGTPEIVAQAGDADTLFGINSGLSSLVKFLLAKGVEYVIAVASASGTTPTLVQRQAAWAALEEDPTVRIRLTDSTVQEDIVALADSCDFADAIQHKQFCFVGIATPTTSAALQAAAAAVASKRGVVTGPGVYDENGVLKGGEYAAAWMATRVALNTNIADDLDLTDLPGSTGIEQDASGLPVFRLHANAGTPVNDLETLLQAGVSPLQQSYYTGAAQITHMRPSYTVDSTYDALVTLLVKDQLFIDIRDILSSENFLRRSGSAFTLGYASKLVETYLEGRATAPDAWINQIMQPDGNLGFGVTPELSADKRNLTIHAQAEIVRNLQTIDIANVLTIPA